MIAQSAGAVNFIVFRCLNCNPCTRNRFPSSPFPWHCLASSFGFHFGEKLRSSCLIRASEFASFSYLGSVSDSARFCSESCVFVGRLGDLVAIWRRICSTHNCCGTPVTFSLVVSCHLRHFCTWNEIAMDWPETRTPARTARLPSCRCFFPLAACAVSWEWFIWARAFCSVHESPLHCSLVPRCCCCRLVVWQRRLIAKQLIRVIGHLTPTCRASLWSLRQGWDPKHKLGNCWSCYSLSFLWFPSAVFLWLIRKLNSEI